MAEARFLKCFSCEVKPATWSCVACEIYMCQICYEIHGRKPANENHKVVSTYGEVTTYEAENQGQDNVCIKPRCSIHHNTLKFYCETCNELVCRRCMESDHKKHSSALAEDVVKEKKEKLKSCSSILDGKLMKGNQALQAVSDAKKCLENDLGDAKEQIYRQKQEILDTFALNLEQCTNEMVEELYKEYKKVHEPLTKQSDDLKWYLQKVKVTSDQTKSILAEGHDDNIISSQKMIEEKIEKIEMDRPKPTKPVHYGVIQYWSKERKDKKYVNILSDLGDVVSSPLLGALYKTSSILGNEEDFIDQMEEWFSHICTWRLCYRATRDGWSAQSFHTLCDNKGPTVTLVKVGDYIFGGYTDQSWGGPDGYKESTSSFLLSLRNKDGLPPFKAPIFQYYKNATWNKHNYGPCFGDMYIYNNANDSPVSYTRLGYMYKPPEGYTYKETKTNSLLAGSYYFLPTEIEVFV